MCSIPHSQVDKHAKQKKKRTSNSNQLSWQMRGRSFVLLASSRRRRTEWRKKISFLMIVGPTQHWFCVNVAGCWLPNGAPVCLVQTKLTVMSMKEIQLKVDGSKGSFIILMVQKRLIYIPMAYKEFSKKQ